MNAQWKILSNYQAFGLGEAVAIEQAKIRRQYPILKKVPDVAWKRACNTVRLALARAIDEGIFYAS